MPMQNPQGVSEFLADLLASGSVGMGELTIESDGAAFRLIGPAGEGNVTEIDLPTESFRQWIRQTEAGAYRPLSGALNLRRGWFRFCPSLECLVEDLEVVYPMASRHLHLYAQGCLRVVAPAEALARQEMLRGGVEPQTSVLPAVTASLCGHCARKPVWGGETGLGGVAIPCPEPCSFWVSLYRVAAGWGHVLPESVAADDSVGFADFALPGNPVREALLRRLG